jgi:hypothetical protein
LVETWTALPPEALAPEVLPPEAELDVEPPALPDDELELLLPQAAASRQPVISKTAPFSFLTMPPARWLRYLDGGTPRAAISSREVEFGLS